MIKLLVMITIGVCLFGIASVLVRNIIRDLVLIILKKEW